MSLSLDIIWKYDITLWGYRKEAEIISVFSIIIYLGDRVWAMIGFKAHEAIAL